MAIPLGLSYDDVLLIPQLTPLRSRSEGDTTGWITQNLKLSAPFLSANMDTVTGFKMAITLARLGGLGVIHQFQSAQKEAAEVARVKAKSGHLAVAAAVGVANGFMERVQAVISAGADLIVIDAAHGHSPFVAASVTTVKKIFPKIPVLAGNIATAAGAEFLIAAGADAIKVGVGPGSVCTTRIIAGAGVPQFTAIQSVAAAVAKFGRRKIGLVADGGIKQPGDAVKALAAGATAIMGGNIFAGCDETPGKIVVRNGRKYKQFRGSSTMGATNHRIKLGGGNGKNIADQWSRVEGIEALIPCRGPVGKVIERYLGGLRSGLSYCGAKNLGELQAKAQFIRVTPAGWRESLPHDVVI